MNVKQDTSRKKGKWLLFEFKTSNAGESIKTRFIDGEVHNINDEWNDCFGSVLFDYMSEWGMIESWDEYDTDGDNEYVAVMHKTGSKPDYSWEFRAYREPACWSSDDCHTFS